MRGGTVTVAGAASADGARARGHALGRRRNARRVARPRTACRCNAVADHRDLPRRRGGRCSPAAPPARRAHVGRRSRARDGSCTFARGGARTRFLAWGRRGGDLRAHPEETRFLVTELLVSGAEALPGTIRDAVLARLAQLSPSARGLLEGVALIPAPVELRLLDAAFPTVADRVDECVQARCARSRVPGVAFRHELTRLAVQSAVAPRRRRDLHAAIWRRLENSPVDAGSARLAQLAEEAGDIEAVVQHGRAAAEHDTATGAHREAVAQYARVLRHADALAPTTGPTSSAHSRSRHEQPARTRRRSRHWRTLATYAARSAIGCAGPITRLG